MEGCAAQPEDPVIRHFGTIADMVLFDPNKERDIASYKVRQSGLP
jgi:N-acyl-D-aspartate/D-glutamate deacylase